MMFPPLRSALSRPLHRLCQPKPLIQVKAVTSSSCVAALCEVNTGRAFSVNYGIVYLETPPYQHQRPWGEVMMFPNPIPAVDDILTSLSCAFLSLYPLFFTTIATFVTHGQLLPLLPPVKAILYFSYHASLPRRLCHLSSKCLIYVFGELMFATWKVDDNTTVWMACYECLFFNRD